MAKALDNRVGCALVVEIMKSLQGVEHPNTAYGVATVQEEVGLRGAATSTYAIKPDIAFALDTGAGAEGMHKEEAQEKLGGGPVVLLYDTSMVPASALSRLCPGRGRRGRHPRPV